MVLTFWRGNPGETRVIDIGRWAGSFDPNADPQDAVLRDAPYWLTVVSGLVTEIEQQYVP